MKATRIQRPAGWTFYLSTTDRDGVRRQWFHFGYDRDGRPGAIYGPKLYGSVPFWYYRAASGVWFPRVAQLSLSLPFAGARRFYFWLAS